MHHASLVGSVLFLEYTWNTFQHWIAFYGMSQKPRKLAEGSIASEYAFDVHAFHLWILSLSPFLASFWQFS
jgi:hypothetical protein